MKYFQFMNKNKLTLLGNTVLFPILSGCGDKQNKTSSNRETVERQENTEGATSHTEINQLSEEEIEDGWELLFDGENTDGWRGYGKNSFPSSGWVIEDGAFKVQGSGGGEAVGGEIL